MRRLFFASQESFSLFTTTVAFTATFGGIAGCGSDQPPAPADVSGDTTSVWAEAAFRGIAAGEYAPQADGAGFRVSNRAQKLQGVFGERGLTVSGQSGGDVSLELRAWGREQTLAEVSPTVPEQGPCLVGGATDAVGECLHRVDYVRPGLTEWWENRPEGLEQGFTVMVPPAGDGAMVFDLTITGASVEVGATEAVLVAAGGARFQFSGLHAYDSRGWDLPAWMESSNGGIRLLVDDSDAVGVVTVDPLLTSSAWTSEVNVAGANLGYSVASAGDVDANGFSDVIVGAPGYDAGTSGGAAFLYLGSASGLASTAAWTATGGAANVLFGSSVATAGDVDGDGYSDVIVGSPGFNSSKGKVSVYYGSSAGLKSTGVWTYASTVTAGKFGSSVACAGDVDGDGYADIVVGAPDYTNSQTNEGAAYLFKGSASTTGLGSSPWLTVESDVASAGFGGSVASAGDFDADGYSDVVVGASTYTYTAGSTTYKDAGAAFLYLGSGSGISATADWTARGDQASAKFGTSVASAGDVNGDGHGDLIVGAPLYDSTLTDEGKAVVYFGSASPPSSAGTADWTTVGGQASAQLGQSVASAGDVNGDGYGDVIIGAPYYENGDTDEGRAYTYLGSTSGPASSSAWSAESDVASALFGYSVASAGDVNGDGYGDVIVGAYALTNGSASEGRAYAYNGSASGLATTALWSDSAKDTGAYYGYSVASAGDVNGDGYGDVAVGAPSYACGGVDTGKVFVYDGSTAGLASSFSWSECGTIGGDGFGTSVASAGDVNGDGYGDLAIGAPNYSLVATGEGGVFVYHGSASGLDSGPKRVLTSSFAGAAFGASVAGSGDVNGDGYADVVVGGYSYDTFSYSAVDGTLSESSNLGMASLYLGSVSGVEGVASWTEIGPQVGESFGYSVASAGDVNGDGYADVVVGAPTHQVSDSLVGAGRVYLYLGNEDGLPSSAAWTQDGTDTDEGLGQSVAAAGDVDGDGYGDVIVGAPGYSNGATNEGLASVYRGSADGLLDVASWTQEGSVAGAAFGSSVASAGDVNGDGYGDIIVGSPIEGIGGFARVYLGSSTSLESTASWSKDTTKSGAYLGGSVASAGDVNGDGFGDVLVGARLEDDTKTESGAASLHMGNGADGTTPLSLRALARQEGEGALIVAGLRSTSGSSFDVSMLTARTAWGAGAVKLEVEAKPLGTGFNGKDTQTADVYTTSEIDGVSLTQTLTGLDAAVGFHWRVRVRGSLAEGRPQSWGPWVYGGISGDASGAHVYTAGRLFYADLDFDGYGDPKDAVGSTALYYAGRVTNSDDCDDNPSTGANISPAVVEVVADGIDQNCDDVDDCYVDADIDGFGASARSAATTVDCSATGESKEENDCDDADPDRSPGTAEIPSNRIDDDCDGQQKCYWDVDNDGYLTTGTLTVYTTGTPDADCDDPYEGAAEDPLTDCDDARASVYPGAPETTTDGRDQNCDGFDNCYLDADNDNYGVATVVLGSSKDCDTGSGSMNKTDCDDSKPTVYPTAPETVGNSIDEDCDGVDSCYQDADGDNYGSSTVLDGSSKNCTTGTGAPFGGDCNEGDRAINPGASEIVGDNVDQNCDVEESCYTDGDKDGSRTAVVVVSTADTSCETADGEALAVAPIDCDDGNSAAYVGASEIVGNEVDNDCDGKETCYVDLDDDDYRPDSTYTVNSSDKDCSDVGEATNVLLVGDCDDSDAAFNPSALEVDCGATDYNCDGLVGYVDADGDGYAKSCGALQDCNDGDVNIRPLGREYPGDGIDGDCDKVDDCYVDEDDDGYGTAVVVTGTTMDCTGVGEAPESSPAGVEDCDDVSVGVNPGASELAGDGVNSDCVTGELCYVDADLDGYRSETKTVVSGDNDCTDAGEASADIPIDCDDVSDVAATINPLAPEVAGDGVDQDCDGFDLCYVDADGDEYRTNATVVGTTEDCTGGGEAPSTAGKDCDDTDASVKPGATEVFADGIDGDCDRLETCFYDADGDGYVNDDIDLDGDVDDDDLAALVADFALPADERVYSVESADPDCSDPFESLNPFTNPVYGGDCDDGDAAYNPGASESDCSDPADYNCDGSVAYEDFDGDGFTACADCDDSAFGVNSDATELPGDGVDQDCDGEEFCYIDGDDDGYRLDPETTFATVNISCDGTLEVPAGGPADCDDADAAVSPGAAEIVGDELDQDCDGTELCFVDADSDSYPADGVATIVSSDDSLCDAAGEATAAALAMGADCADDDPARYPGAPEEDCADSVDYNCDGSSGTVDADQDGFGACYDCDDASSSVNDNAVEVCNHIDDDCDHIIDEDAADASTWYADMDGDGYSDREATLVACDQPDGFIPAATRDDCDDADATSFPGGDDVPQDGVDQDCDGEDAAFADTGTGADDESGSGSGEADAKPCGCASSGGPGAAGAMLIAAFVMGIRRRRLAKQAS